MAETQLATFGAGCFWGVEFAFQEMEGVIDTEVGFEGGTLDSPSYRDVCSDRTGHAEVVQIQFDPHVVSYKSLLDKFFELHDPTQLNRQGTDLGSQYRSVIFYHSPEQEIEAKEARIRWQERFAKPIVTQIVPAKTFFAAEDYHQDYLRERGLNSCHL